MVEENQTHCEINSVALSRELRSTFDPFQLGLAFMIVRGKEKRLRLD